jgi:hypothetical protein
VLGLRHRAELVELGTDRALSEATLGLGKALNDFKGCHNADVVLMLPGPGKVTSDLQHLRASDLGLPVFHFRPSFFIALSRTAADASHNSAPMLRPKAGVRRRRPGPPGDDLPGRQK